MNLLLLLGGFVGEVSFNLTDPPDTLLFSGGPGSYGVPGDMTDPADTLDLYGNSVSWVYTAGDMTDAPDVLFMSGLFGMVGLPGDMTDPADTLLFAGQGGAYIGSSFSLADPADTLLFFVANRVVATQEYILYAMNMQNGAVTKLPYAIESMCELDGIIYAAGPAGIMIFEGAGSNNGAPINSRIAKSGMNFGTNKLKTITDFRMRCRTQGSMKVTSSSEMASGSVTTPDGLDILHGFKSDLPRGVNGQELEIAVENVDGCDFEMAEFEFEIDVSSHRKGRQTRN